ncbi:hypothetical protein [Chryseobacterium sp. Leaf394]|uniref:hypothetical protein n=1 Tax=Chryseobacterium sp. Leaf394 TaxID=1736361 RepID=UPI0006F44090|nr:hypothetical protein [Chryseobacterium sp. Leaf394]KQS90231.1 hypothetical protein ASG21_14850 [Chryseobacterium sp. Leaf394]
MSDFVDYLLFKKEKDWAENLSEEEKNSIEQGLEDIKNGRLHSHESVMDEISEYIKSGKNDLGRMVGFSEKKFQKDNRLFI